jgi:hypothetical protein
MPHNHLIDQKLSGLLSGLDSVPTAQLNHPVSQQFAENYNSARQAVIDQNADLDALAPPHIDILPDRGVEATYLEVRAYVGELHTFVHNKIAAENRERLRNAVRS